ncbi:MAG: transglutaminase family protein [Planctomycetes bacterium]|nr:transglutaminase family protein [Planctomycetota bacterium]
MKYKVVHVTRYVYTDLVTLCHNQAHLTPRETKRQKCIRCKIDVNPAPAIVQPWLNAFGNTTTYFSIEQPHRELSLVAESEVEVSKEPLSPDPQRQTWEETAERLAGSEFCAENDPLTLLYRWNRLPFSDAVRDYAYPSFKPRRPQFDAVLELTQRIYADFEYDPTATTISTTPIEILDRRRGVCQDFAQLQIACLRSLGLLARYVSGYLVTKPPPGKPRLVGADATHAWVSVFFPDWGWIDFDPTNNRLADSNYVTLAWGRDYGDVSPVRGVFIGGGAHRMTVSVDVVPSEN